MKTMSRERKTKTTSDNKVTSFTMTGDVNGDGRADVVCTSDGSMIVWQSKDVEQNENIYDPNSKWIDEVFGFCKLQDKMVIFID